MFTSLTSIRISLSIEKRFVEKSALVIMHSFILHLAEIKSGRCPDSSNFDGLYLLSCPVS